VSEYARDGHESTRLIRNGLCLVDHPEMARQDITWSYRRLCGLRYAALSERCFVLMAEND
jgi:hypothetical protein